jgi:hypothetical protein
MIDDIPLRCRDSASPMKISRRELYDRIWITPMSKLARELDISDVGLAKVCRRYGIPRPARGYWAKLAVGKAPPKPSLPASETETVELDAARHRIPEVPKVQVDTEILRVAQRATGGGLAGVAAATFERLSRVKPTADGFVTCGSSRVLACSLTPATVERACKVLDAIERGLPLVGGRFFHNQEEKRVEVEVGGVRLGLTLAEDYKRTETVTTDPKYSWRKTSTFTYHFSGQLRLTISGDYAGRKSWGDGKQSRLEDKVESVIAGLAGAAQAIAALRTEREEQRRRWAEEARRAEVARERQRRMMSFADKLQKEAGAWHRYCEVSAYVDHLNSLLSAGAVLPDKSKEWLRLATHLTRLTDPSRTRLELLTAGIEGYEWDLPFGRSVVP